MKKKKLTLLIGIISIFIFNNYNVNAKSYTSGDLVTIKLNEHETKEFYIIADSAMSKDTVTAISKTVLGDGFSFDPKNSEFKDSLIDQHLKSLTVSWQSPINIRLINVDEVENNPAFQGEGASYWTQTIKTEAAEFFPHIVKVNRNVDKSLTAKIIQINDVNREDNKAFIRPVITINKSYIFGDNDNEQDNTTNNNHKQDENKTFWDAFIKQLIVEITNNNNNDNKIYTKTLNYTENSISIISKDNNGNTYTSTFTYQDGILSLVPSEDATIKQATADLEAILDIINTYSKIKGYDVEKLLTYIKENPNLTLKNDGIEITYKTFDEGDKNSNSYLSLDLPTSFSINLLKGFTSFEKYLATQNFISNNQTIDVPNTRKDIPIYVKTTAIILILTGIALLIEENHRKKMLNK